MPNVYFAPGGASADLGTTADKWDKVYANSIYGDVLNADGTEKYAPASGGGGSGDCLWVYDDNSASLQPKDLNDLTPSDLNTTEATLSSIVEDVLEGKLEYIPVGSYILWGSNNVTLPQGYLECNGAAVSRTMYADLFTAIGTTYGAGDGSTTFNLPNYSDGKFFKGYTTAGTVSQTGTTGTAISSMTCRVLIKAFDGQTASSALIDITQFANDLANKADRSLSNLKAFHRDVITTSGTYTAPATGLYKFTAVGGGGGGAGGFSNGTVIQGGSGGGSGGYTIRTLYLTAGDTVDIVIGAGGTGGAKGVIGSIGTVGGDTTFTYNGTTYTAGGGKTHSSSYGSLGGSGDIPGMAGSGGYLTPNSNGMLAIGGSGGGFGGGYAYEVNAQGNFGGGGGGGYASYSGGIGEGKNGANGCVWIEYFA